MQAADFTRQEVRRYLKGCAWPCGPSICIQVTRDNGAPLALLAHLEALPNRVYLSESELLDELERAGALAGREQAAVMANEAGVQVGMKVIGTDGAAVGRVKELRESDFLLDLRLARDLYVPFDAVREVEAGQVVLNVKCGDVPYQHWPSPKLF